MSLSATFGSFGDIISLCIIIKDLCKALDQSQGSSTEYREIIAELWVLDDVLVQAQIVCEGYERSDELEALYFTLCRSAHQCRHSIKNFHKKVKKFGPSLRESGSGNIVRDAARKIQWQVFQSHELTKFRAEIIAHCSSLNMLLTTTGMWVGLKIH